MAQRILIVGPDTRPLFGMDGHHGDDHAAAWIADSLALLAERGIAGCAVLELDTMEGGDGSRDIMRALDRLTVETRQRPDGRRELVGVHFDRTRPAARAVRILHAPDDWHGPRSTIRNKPGTLAARAQRWREQTHPTHARIARRTGG